MTPGGIEPAIFRFVAQHLGHCATAVPHLEVVNIINHSYENIPWVLVVFGIYTTWSVKILFLQVTWPEVHRNTE